jgi:hypothetical protein
MNHLTQEITRMNNEAYELTHAESPIGDAELQ